MSHRSRVNGSDKKEKISRRDFIKFLGTAGAAFTLLPIGRAIATNTTIANNTGSGITASSQANMTSSQLQTNTKSKYTYDLDRATPQNCSQPILYYSLSNLFSTRSTEISHNSKFTSPLCKKVLDL